MPNNEGVIGQLEVATGHLNKLASIVSGKKDPLGRVLRATRPEDETRLKIEQLDPVDDFVECERLKIVVERQTRLSHDIAKYTEEFKELQTRLTYRKSISAIAKVSSLFWGAPTHVPTQEEILRFIDKIIQASQRDYGEDCDAIEEYSDLISHVKTLGYALGISIKLKLLDEKLSKDPLQDLETRERELFDLIDRQRSCRGFFSNLGREDHPFNIIIWNNVVSYIENDLKNLLYISTKLNTFSEAITNAMIEKDLPTHDDIAEVEQYIDTEFGKIRSPRHAMLRMELVNVKEAIRAIKDDKAQQAKLEFAEFVNQFDIWRSTINDIQTDFIEFGGKSFPWRFLPPSQKEVKALELQIEQKRSEYQDWPCVDSVMSKKDFHLEHYQRLLITMKDVTEDRINQAFNDPSFSIKKIQHYIKIYRVLLHKGGYDDEQEALSNIRLRLFRFAHNQHKETQWFSFFRRSYYDNLTNISWADIAANMNGKNFGYSGTRTNQVLTTLGWLDDGNLSSLAPPELQSRSELIRTADDYRVTNQMIL